MGRETYTNCPEGDNVTATFSINLYGHADTVTHTCTNVYTSDITINLGYVISIHEVSKLNT